MAWARASCGASSARAWASGPSCLAASPASTGWRAANRGGPEHWLGLALDAGYHDHQHLARDFRQFTLATPSEFLTLEWRAPERWFGFRE